MNDNIKRTFDAVQLSTEQKERLRSQIVAHQSGDQAARVAESRKRPDRHKRILLVAVCLVLVLALVGFGYGKTIIQMLGGGRIEIGSSGPGQSTTTMEMGFTDDPVVVRDGRVFFLLDDSGRDITDYCTASTYYLYECTDEQGYQHLVIVSGKPDNLGWGESIWNEQGQRVGASYDCPDESMLEWLATMLDQEWEKSKKNAKQE